MADARVGAADRRPFDPENLDFGFLTCPETAPGTDRIAEGFPFALEELERGAGLPAATPSEASA